ncbi:hypothetical protein L211DRAFT_835364 [Terfezia boudieri ATCC MYA-4762]|uniref:Uncharacterized protein n=1 Tax=Terfezia boudieri ATCC MYA-4762 TaxID=1051890 RepID=A0A3N4LY91_9PEZI|nr:hypothetical protein L211DRAFT_835364 [Terfezia boudieri ATCC MYA-4762]
MAQELGPVPDVGVLVAEVTNVSDNYRNLSQSYEALATQTGRIQNIPILNVGQQIVQELRRLNERLNERLDRMELQFAASFASMDYNWIARQFNKHAFLSTTYSAYSITQFSKSGG